MGIQGGPDIIEDGLVLYLDAANKRSYPGSGTTLTDIALSNNGTLTNGASFDSGDFGSISFDGTNDHIVTTTNINLLQNWTLEAWVKFNNISSNRGIFGHGTLSTNNGLHIAYFPPTRKLVFAMYANDNDYRDEFTPTIGVWYNLSFSYNHSTYNKETYVNGTLLTPYSSVENAYQRSAEPLRIGHIYGTSSGTQAPFNGNITAVRMYTRVLSQSEIQHNFNVLRGRFGI